MSKPALLIIGTGSEATLILDTLEVLDAPYQILGLVETSSDKAKSKISQSIKDVPVIGSIDELKEFAKFTNYYVAAVEDNYSRVEASMRAETLGINPTRIIHPRSTISPSARIEPGVIIHPNSVVSSFAVVRAGTIINSGAVIEYKSKIGPYSLLGSNSVLSKFVTVDASVRIGQNCTILSKVKVGRNVVIEPGSVVIDKIPSNTRAAGNPAVVVHRFTDSEIRYRTARRRKK